jgi:hypothetical protein
MAEVTIKPEYQQYADAMIESLKREKLKLSPYSEMLLRLSVEAWFEEPPQMKDYKPWLPKKPPTIRADERKKFLEFFMARIIEEASKEPHIEIDKGKNKPVPFSSFIYGLATSGRDVLGGWLKKDFR